MLQQQLGNAELVARAHDVIDNRGEGSDLESQVEALHERYLELAAK